MMEWREQSAVNYEDAFSEAQRWIEAVTKKAFGSNNFRSALENGVLLCDLINRIKPGIIKRVNRLSTPIAGLDNLNVFLRACGKLGLKEAQLFHPGDLQDLSSRVTIKRQETSRRLKNVLITLYWLGRTAQNDPLYHGPYLNLKAFEGLLGIALSKALEDSLVSQRGGSSSVRDSGFGDSWYCEREDLFYLRGGRQPRRENSLDSLDSESSRPASISSDTTLKGSSEGCYSDTEGDSIFKMADNKDPLLYRRSLVVTPKTATQFNQFLPTKDKSSGYVPAPLRKKRAERQEDNRRSWVGPQFTEEDGTFTSETSPSTNLQGNGLPQGAPPAPHPERAYQYESGSDSDAERPDPDLVLDDLASRRFHSPSPAPPTNFAVPIGLPEGGVLGGRVGGGGGGTWPRVSASSGTPPRQTSTFLSSSSSALCAPRHASVRVDHGPPTSADSLLRQLWDDSEDEDDEDGYADPVQDDLYARKVGISPQPITSAPYNKFLPKFWTPEEDMHIQKIKLGSQRRPWYRKMQGFRALRKPDGIDGSKSMSDIAVDTASLRQVRYEELQKFREQVKESEDKWQDDLTKWKNRRRSVNSDIVKKKEEREVVEVLTGSSRKSKTFREMQEERENRDTRSSLSSRLSSLTSLDQDVFEEPVPVPRTRTLPTRSYTIDTPCTVEDRPTSRSVAPLREDPPPASLEPNRAISPPTVDKVDTGGLPTASSLISILKPSSPHPPATMEISSSPVNTEEDTSAPTPNLLMKAPEARLPWAGRQAKETPSAGLLDEQPQPGSGMPPGVSRVSASLPRSYQRSDSARLTSVVTARPFGTQSTRVTSLPRAFTMDESLRRVNGEPEAASKPLPSIPVLGRYGQVMTSEDEARSSSAQSSNEEEEEEGEEEKEEKEEERSGTPTASVYPVGPQIETDSSGPQTKAVSPIPVPVSPTPPKDTNQESFCDMRISLNQKPNSSRDFGFHADWDSTGAHITSIQTGSSAEQCQLQVGDEVLAVSGHKVSDMNYSEWTSSLEDALQQGSLVLDVRRHGKNHWDRDHPSLPFKSHKIINLTSMDHPTLVGGPEKTTVNTTSLDFTSSTSNESAKEVASHPIIDMASNGVNGSFLHKPVTLRNKESEPISLKNLKRRSEFFEQGGSESAISDLAVPSIAPSSTRWSWDPEEERRRQEKWQKEQELLLQEKYKRDQEKLEEEWRRAQQEAVNQDSTHQQEAQISLEVNNSSSSPHSPSSPLSQATPPWEGQDEAQSRALEEERSRLEEQERRRQEEERRKREEEERELERLQEERKRREQQEEEEKRIREEEELKWQRKRQEEREEERRRQEEQQRKERERDQEKQRGGDSYGYAQVQPELSMTDRVKSKSTPHLDDVDSPDSRGRYGRPGGMAQRLLEEELRRQQDRKAQGQRAASQLELERRDILNAMRYREPERVTSSGSASWGKKGDSLSQAEAERQQILREMKKKTQLLTDNSWIRQRSTSTTTSREPIDLPGPIRRGDSLDNLDGPRSSWRSSWTPGSMSSIPNYSRPHSAMSTSGGGAGTGSWARPGSSTLPSSYSMSSLRAGGGNPSSSWSQRSSSPTSPSPTTSPEPPAEQHQPSQQQRSRSVSGKKICTLCDSPLGKGAAMIIESLGLCYHLGCFKCIDCRCDLGGSEAGAEVRIRNKQLYCNSCYVRFKSGQPTSM